MAGGSDEARKSDPFGARRRMQRARSPGSYRRSFLWGFWSIMLVAAVTLVDTVVRGNWIGLVTPLLLALAGGMLSRTHHHQQAVLELPPADGEDSFRRRTAAKQAHERAELAWSVATLVALAAAFVVPALLG